MPLLRTLAAAATLLAAGCDSSDAVSTPCEVSASTAASSIPVSVTYRATASAASTVATIRYRGAAGTETVNRPSLPWQTVVTLAAGVAPTISATGTAVDGQVAVTVAATGQAGGTTVNLNGSDSCEAGSR